MCRATAQPVAMTAEADPRCLALPLAGRLVLRLASHADWPDHARPATPATRPCSGRVADGPAGEARAAGSTRITCDGPASAAATGRSGCCTRQRGQLSLDGGRAGARRRRGAAAARGGRPLPPTAAAALHRTSAAGVTLASRRPMRTRLRALHRGQLLLVQEDAQGACCGDTRCRRPARSTTCMPPAETLSDLGRPRPTRGADRFKLWAPTAQRVALCLLSSAAMPARRRCCRCSATPRTGIWSARVPRRPGGPATTPMWSMSFVPGTGLVRNRVTDPYSRQPGDRLARAARSSTWTTPALKPAGWDDDAKPPPRRAPADMVIYELHVRDFSIGDDDACRPRTAAPTWRSPNDAATACSTCARWPRAGLTHVHLLPVFDIATVDGDAAAAAPTRARRRARLRPSSRPRSGAVAANDGFNWGYDPCTTPCPRAATPPTPTAPARIVEFRAMVQALHRAGLRVVHGRGLQPHHRRRARTPKSVLDRIVPGYYHRLDATARSRPAPAARTPPPSTR